jgi:alkylhydroperoxidase family enzyme
MAFINYVAPNKVPSEHQVDDQDNILQIHGIHPRVIRLHHDLYVELMHRPGPLTRTQREAIGVLVSSINQCHY